MTFDELFAEIERNFTVELIAQPLHVYDSQFPESDALSECRSRSWEVVPFGRSRSDGDTFWIDEVIDLAKEPPARRPVEPRDLISSSTSLVRMMDLLVNRNFYFVLVADRVNRIVTRSDLNQLPVRVLVFTVLAHVEMLFAQAIAAAHPKDAWFSLLSEKARTEVDGLQAQKKRGKMDTQKIDCTTLGQKCTIIERTEAIRQRLGYKSKTAFGKARKPLGRLRDLLHHGEELKPAHEDSLCDADAQNGEPEDSLRDAIAHNAHLVTTEDDIRWLRDSMQTFRTWVSKLSDGLTKEPVDKP